MSTKQQQERPCPLCGGRMRYWLTGYDLLYATTRRGFPVFRCSDCRLERILPVPGARLIRSFYPSDYYSYTGRPEGFFNRLREKIVDRAYRPESPKDGYYYLAWLARPFFSGLPLAYLGARRFLDVGCGDGENLRLLSRYGWRTQGFEIGPTGRRGNIRYGPSLSAVGLADQAFDYIRVWHVLEHVPDPHRFMATLAKLLAVDGELVIGLPNTASLYAWLFGRYWYGRDIPRHLVNYRVRNLKRLLAAHGLRAVRVKHQAAKGFLGGLELFLNHRLRWRVSLINRAWLILLCYPLDLVCNLLRVGDTISVTVRHSSRPQKGSFRGS